MAKVIGVCISTNKGEQKKEILKGEVIEGFGLKGDAHGGDWHRQISLLAIESIAKMKSPVLQLENGDFAENIITEGIDLVNLPIGTQLKIGQDVILEVTQIGKECHSGCAIMEKAGSCIMPTEGIFTKVIAPGILKKNDTITILSEA